MKTGSLTIDVEPEICAVDEWHIVVFNMSWRLDAENQQAAANQILSGKRNITNKKRLSSGKTDDAFNMDH
jgi:hypothetical protein